jgi:hypothetical protein
MLFHVTQLFNICAKHVLFIQSPAKSLTDEAMLAIWQRFYRAPSVSVRSAQKVSPGARVPTARESAGVLSPNR